MNPLFGFRLRPLPNIVQNWQTIDFDIPKYLSGWFWLTDGWYWIATPDGDVPLGHPDFNTAFDFPPDVNPHLDYQVARFWMDLEEMLPDVLDPLPEELARAMASGEWKKWWSAFQVWWDNAPENGRESKSQGNA